MDEKTLRNLEQLEQLFQYTNQVCDPLDYAIRQRNLVYTVTNYLLLPLMEFREEQARLKKETEEAAKATQTASEMPAIESIQADA